MSLSDEIEELAVIQDETREEAQQERQARKHIKGWEKGVTIEGGSGYVYSGAVDGEPSIESWDDIIREFGLDPAIYEIDPMATLDLRVWDMPIGKEGKTGPSIVKRMHYYRAPVRLVASHSWLSEEEFAKGLERYKAPPKSIMDATYEGPNGFVVCLSDWQIGKKDGDGSVGIRDRIMASAQASLDRYTHLRKLGIEIGTVYLIGMGDMIEQCDGHYASQAFKTDLNERQQQRLAGRLFRDIVVMFSRVAQRVVVASVGGNHGENRRNGKAFTDTGDNADMMLVDITADALSMNPDAFNHVSFVALENQLWCTLDVYGTTVGFTHGHLARGGASPELKQKKWISNQALAKSDIGDADVFVTGHFHSFQVSDWGPRMWLQCPTQDGGSEWFENSTGASSSTGFLTFVSGPRCSTPADFIKVC